MAKLTEAQRTILVALDAAATTRPGINKAWTRPPHSSFVESVIKELLQDRLIRPIQPYSKVVRLTEAGRTALTGDPNG